MLITKLNIKIWLLGTSIPKIELTTDRQIAVTLKF